ncbi:Beta-glucanase [Golovinomyces cichoracearum]|uniref:Beta-glucanase n=1 Tax=Golovinomyces cichoracearum TaxID=62708 RepID=A0A420IEN1_9PEZI|nr:Beta-glucanase [Golovinomyces cichoracearum]
MLCVNTINNLIKKIKTIYHKFIRPVIDKVKGASPPSPPPIHYATKPPSNTGAINCGPSSAHFTYWHPVFHPSTPIWTYFEQKIGADGWGNNEVQNYTRSPVNSFFTPDNKLVVRAISRPDALEDKYTSARLVSKQNLDRTRGYLTARLTVPCAQGIWPAFWLLPAEPFTWPTDGEIDICESWNGLNTNHSCLHWGHYNAEDNQKHRVMETTLDSTNIIQEFSLAWEQVSEKSPQSGRLLWYLNGLPVMRASIPEGIRPMRDFQIILNVAMGGNVCQGVLPAAGVYDLIVHDIRMSEEPRGGWEKFRFDWDKTNEGNTM